MFRVLGNYYYYFFLQTTPDLCGQFLGLHAVSSLMVALRGIELVLIGVCQNRGIHTDT